MTGPDPAAAAGSTRLVRHVVRMGKGTPVGTVDTRAAAAGAGAETTTREDVRAAARSAARHQESAARALRRGEPRFVGVVATLLLAALAVYTVWLPYVGAYVPPMTSRIVQIAAAGVGLVLLRFSPRRGALAGVLLALALGVWFATSPIWSAWNPETRLVIRQNWVVASNIVTASWCLLLAGGRRSGTVALRRMWVAVLLSTAPVGVWEVLTHDHLLPPEAWKAPAYSPAATFGNPNNFAVVLTVGFGLALCAASERMPRCRRAGWLVLAAVCGALEMCTLSRGADLSCAILALVAAGLWAHRSGVDARALVGRYRRAMTGAGVALVALVVAFFTVPPLAALNPALRVLAPGDDVTARSDSLRLTLVRVALHEWEASPWTGIGTGHIALILRRRNAEFSHIASLHNGFVEFLAEYGILMSAPFVALLLLLTWRLLAPRRAERSHGAPAGLDHDGARAALAVYLVAFTQAGVVVASSLPWAIWWLLLASAAATGWWVGGRGRRVARVDEDATGAGRGRHATGVWEPPTTGSLQDT